MVHGGQRRPIDQSGSGAHDGEAREGQDGRSEVEPRGLHVSSEGDGAAHRRGRHLRQRQRAVIGGRSAEPGSRVDGDSGVTSSKMTGAKVRSVVFPSNGAPVKLGMWGRTILL